MSRRLAPLSLLCAWLCASGAMLDVAQTLAWARMFAGYARTESIAEAARETFDPAKPCGICRAVAGCRDAGERHGTPAPVAGPEKIVLIFEGAAPFVAAAVPIEWPRIAGTVGPVAGADVPVPPPRGSPSIAAS
jgi:hypothetical protein